MLALPYGRPGSELIFAYFTLLPIRAAFQRRSQERGAGDKAAPKRLALMDSWQAREQTAPQVKRLRAKAEEIARAMAEGRRR